MLYREINDVNANVKPSLRYWQYIVTRLLISGIKWLLIYQGYLFGKPEPIEQFEALKCQAGIS